MKIFETPQVSVDINEKGEISYILHGVARSYGAFLLSSEEAAKMATVVINETFPFMATGREKS